MDRYPAIDELCWELARVAGWQNPKLILFLNQYTQQLNTLSDNFI